MITVDERFDLKVDRSAGPDACWPWTAVRTSEGYGRFKFEGRSGRAHRFALARRLGRSLSPGEQALHRCDNPPCVNPSHLWVGDNAENMADKRAKGRSSNGESRNGERHPMAKLTAAQVADLRVRYAAGGIGQRALAREFGLSQAQVSNIVSGARWRNA